jgi:hypothetical protein
MRREKELREEMKEVEVRQKRELESMKVESEKYRKNALEELQSVFMKLQK